MELVGVRSDEDFEFQVQRDLDPEAMVVLPYSQVEVDRLVVMEALQEQAVE